MPYWNKDHRRGGSAYTSTGIFRGHGEALIFYFLGHFGHMFASLTISLGALTFYIVWKIDGGIGSSSYGLA